MGPVPPTEGTVPTITVPVVAPLDIIPHTTWDIPVALVPAMEPWVEDCEILPGETKENLLVRLLAPVLPLILHQIPTLNPYLHLLLTPIRHHELLMGR